MLWGLPNQPCSMTDSSASQIHQTIKNDLSIVCCSMISNLGTVIMITTECAECDMQLLWMQDLRGVGGGGLICCVRENPALLTNV